MLLCVDGYDKSAPQKVQQAVKKEVQSIADHYLPDVKVLDSNNAFQFCNAIANAGQKLLSWRQHRSYFISSDVELLPDKANEPNSDRCNVRIGAYIRGVPLNVNSMVHFVGVGMGQISRISMDKISDGSREDSFFHRTIYADDFK